MARPGISAPDKLRLLIVEDDLLDFRQLREALRARRPDRFFVRHAPAMDQAAEILADERFDVILLDISLPDGSGVDQIETVRRLAPGALILSLGSIYDEEAGLTAVAAGAQEFLIKERLDGLRLEHAIEFAIARRDFQREASTQERQLQALLDQVDELAIVVSATGFVTGGHDNLRRVLEHHPQDLHFKTWINLLHPDDQHTARDVWSQVLREAGVSGELTARLPRPGGRWREHRLKLVNFLDDPAIDGVAITGADVATATALGRAGESWSALSQAMLGEADLDLATRGALAAIGPAVDARDVRVIQYRPANEPGQLEARSRAAWRQDGGTGDADLSSSARAAVADIDILMKLREIARQSPADGLLWLPARHHDEEPVALVPIFTRDRLWGALMLHMPAGAAEWLPEQRLAIKSLSDALGALLTRAGGASSPTTPVMEPFQPPASGWVDWLAQVFDDVRFGVALFDRHARLTYANPATETITGMAAERFFATQSAFLPVTEMLSFDQTFERPDGTIVQARIDLAPVADERGEPDGGIIAIQDTSSIRRAAQLMHGNEARLRAIVATAIEAILTLDGQGRIESLNPAAEEMFGVDGDAAVGKHLSELTPTAATEGGELLLHGILDAAAEHADGRVRELRAVRADGTVFPIDMNLRHYDHRNRRKYIASVRDISERRVAEERISAQLRQLQALHRVDRVLNGSRDQQVILDVVADQVVLMPGLDVAVIRGFSDVTHRLELKIARGLPPRAEAAPVAALGEGLAGIAAMARSPLRLRERPEALVSDGGGGFLSSPALDGLAIPLVANSQLKGTLEVYSLVPGGISDDTANFLESIASQAAIAIDDTEMFAALARSQQLLESAYEATLEGWSRALEMRKVDTEGHSRRVSELAVELGRVVGLDGDELVALRRGALLHDIGKIGVPDAVLHKPGRLDDEDWAMIREIPRHAMSLLNGIPFLRDASDVPYFHHEKWDGTGYPNGLAGEAIPLAARIFAVVDVWDTLNSDRPYRSALPPEEAIEQIAAQSGKSFDPRIVAAFLQVVGGDGPDDGSDDLRLAESPAGAADPESAGDAGGLPMPAALSRT